MTLRRAIALVLVASGLLAACSSGRPASVDISSRAFGFSPDGSDSYESILLSGKFDNDAAVLALQRAATRFMLVTSDGTEHPSEESVERVVGTGLLYSPNYVTDPRVRRGGIEFYVDCKGVIEPPMADTFRRILRQELDEAGITDARVEPITF